MIRNFPFLVLMSLMLSSCALTTDQINYNYQSDNFSLPKTSSHKTIKIMPVVDARNEENPNIIIHKINLDYQTATGGYTAPQPITNYLNDALQQALSEAGYHIVPQNPVVYLSSKILSMNCQVISGAFTATTQCNMLVDFALYNATTHKQLWNETLNGSGSDKNIKTNPVAAILNQTINQVVKNLLTNDGFRYTLTQ